MRSKSNSGTEDMNYNQGGEENQNLGQEMKVLYSALGLDYHLLSQVQVLLSSLLFFLSSVSDLDFHLVSLVQVLLFSLVLFIFLCTRFRFSTSILGLGFPLLPLVLGFINCLRFIFSSSIPNVGSLLPPLVLVIILISHPLHNSNLPRGSDP